MITLKGVVVRNMGSLYTVAVEGTHYNCKLKGNFKLQDIKTTNPIAVGDKVSFDWDREEQNERQIGWITEIAPRTNYIIRRSSNLSKQAHILGANLDRTLLIVTVNFPITSTTFIDRYLATAEAYQVEVALLFNKLDRYSPKEMQRLKELKILYEGLGYPCFAISAKTGEGMQEVQSYVSTGVTLLSGHSGVGKSTFINALIPEAGRKTSDISEVHNVGVHTTTYSEMLLYQSQEKEAYIIDTPGIKGFGIIDFDIAEVGHYFREIFELSKECYYSNCSHQHEPKCAVRQARLNDLIAESRYRSYLSILNEDEEKKYRQGYST